MLGRYEIVGVQPYERLTLSFLYQDDVLDGSDRMAVQRARQSVLKEMINEMFSEIRKLSGK